MYTFLLVIHIVVCFTLIFVVLIQSSKGAEMGSAFGGGGSQTLFGGRGASSFLAKMTTAVAILFMVISLTLAFYTVKKPSLLSDMPAVSQDAAAPAASTPGPVTADPAATAPAPEKAE